MANRVGVVEGVDFLAGPSGEVSPASPVGPQGRPVITPPALLAQGSGVCRVEDMAGPSSGSIMVIEDDADCRDSLMQLLADLGYQVCGVANGAEAIDALRDGSLRPALFVLDLKMPVMDGAAFLAFQRTSVAHYDIPVFLMTAASEGEAEQARALGTARVFRKPLPLDTFVAAVGQLVARVTRP